MAMDNPARTRLVERFPVFEGVKNVDWDEVRCSFIMARG